jgi:hypothetical protein
MVLWMRYAEPGSNQAGVIKPKLDLLMPEIEKICRKSVKPKVMWYDLRPVWGNKGIDGTYSTDGLHPTAAGAQATADAFWKAIKDSNFFDTGTTAAPSEPTSRGRSRSAVLARPAVFGQTLSLSLTLAQAGDVTVRLTTIAGRVVFIASRCEPGTGIRTVQFHLGAIAPGVYGCEVRTAQFSESSTIALQ